MIPVAVIGAGPAGVAAAIQLQRSGIEFLLIEKSRIGGLLHEANRVENFPGVSGGVAGKTLAARLKLQLRTAGIPVEKTRVLRLAYHGDAFAIQAEKQTLAARRVILACGTQPLPPGPPLDRLPQGRVCDSVLPLLQASRKTIAIIGGGDAALDYALSLAGRNQVHVLSRSGTRRALPLLLDRCRRNRNIRIHENSRLASAAAGEGAAEIILETVDASSGRKGKIACHLVLTAIGRAPALHFLDADLRATLAKLESQKKIFLAGDVGNGRFRQATIAAADGLRAAMDILAEEKKWK